MDAYASILSILRPVNFRETQEGGGSLLLRLYYYCTRIGNGNSNSVIIDGNYLLLSSISMDFFDFKKTRRSDVGRSPILLLNGEEFAYRRSGKTC